MSRTASAVPLRVAVLGCGWVAQASHLPAILAAADLFELVAVADVDADRARTLAGRAGLGGHAVFTDAEDLRRRGPQLDLAVIATPTARHATDVRLLARTSAAVLCEKPLAVDARTAAAAAYGAPDRIGVVHHLLHQRNVMAALAMTRSGRLGAVRLVRLRHTADNVSDRWQSWRMRPDGGGVVRDLAYHEVYLAEALHGTTVRRVCAGTRSEGAPVETTALALLDHGTGMSVVELDWNAGRDDHQADVVCADGELRLRDGMTWLRARGRSEWEPIPLSPDSRGTFGRFYAQVATRVSAGEAPGTGLADALRTLRVVDSCRAIGHSGWTDVADGEPRCAR